MKQIVIGLIIMLLPAMHLLAQRKGIVLIGKVVSFEEHTALEGVVVEVKGTKNVSGTLYDGMYAIEIQPGDSILVFSYEGYETREIKISKDKREYDVLLKSKSFAIDRSVVQNNNDLFRYRSPIQQGLVVDSYQSAFVKGNK